MLSLTDPTVLIYVMTIWHCFWSSECAIKSTYYTIWRGCISMVGKSSLIECVKTVNEICELNTR